MSRPVRLAPAFALVFACASAPPPKPAPKPPPPKVEDEDVVTITPTVEHITRTFEKERPPPPRRQRQKVVTEKEYQQLAKKFTLGIKPAECVSLCKADAPTSDDGRWTWVLRCRLDRGLKDEPVVACREEAMEAEDAARAVSR